MKSWKITEVAGIGIHVHWSFLILPLLIAGSELSAGSGVAVAVQAVVFVLAIFGCVLLHELGHALTARQFGVATHSITLLPIGGVANLDRIPREPLHELLIALAGPAVNVAIATALFMLLIAFGMLGSLPNVAAISNSFLLQLLLANVILVLFNLLPAFPMDGGRVLRSLLASFLSYSQATKIAAGIGQVMAGLFALVAIMSQQWLLLIVAMFVFFAGRAESRMAQAQAATEGWSVGDAMRRQFHMVPADMTLEQAAQAVLFAPQDGFPVIEDGRLAGMLSKQQAMQLLSQGQNSLLVRDVMQENVPILDLHLPLEESMDRMQTGNYTSMPVASDGRLVGILSASTLRHIMAGWTVRPAVIDP
ncbi:MAG: site-2 protease family protein [Planctomycetota bacterium]